MKKKLEKDLEEDEEDFEEDEKEIEEEVEESGLEESLVLKEPTLNLDFNNLNFDQFTPSIRTMDSGSPVLESIESRIDSPGFVQMGTVSSQSESRLGESSGDTYIPSQGGDDGPKYIESGGEIRTDIGRVDMQKLGRDVGGFNTSQPQNFFVSSESEFQSTNVEHTGMQPGRIDFQNIGRQNPLEIEERKYDEPPKYEFEPSK